MEKTFRNHKGVILSDEYENGSLTEVTVIFKGNYLIFHKKTPCNRLQVSGKGVLQTNEWAHLDLNQGPMDYESTALTN